MQSRTNSANSQERKSNAYRVHGAPPANAEKQAQFVLRVLREAGNHGVNRDHFLQGSGPCGGRRVTQVGARLDELSKAGYIFESKLLHGDLFVTYYLRREPTAPAKPVTAAKGWKAQGFAYGKQAQQESAPQPVQAFLNLFDAMTASGSSNKSFIASEMGVKLNW